MDTLTDARLLCVTDDVGNLLIGKAPPAHNGFSAEFLCACADYGTKGKRK